MSDTTAPITNFPRMITGSSITVVVKGKTYSLRKDHPTFDKLKEALKTREDEETVFSLLTPKALAEKLFAGKVTVVDERVYLDGEQVTGFLVDRIIEQMQEGFDIEPLSAFLANLSRNPNPRIREQLFRYLEAGQNPITPDGKFLAFKKVRQDFMDYHSGTVSYEIGTVVEIDRANCDLNENESCSRGLHFCARDYLGKFWSNEGRVLIVEIDPADVVAIPYDYNNTKGRTARMKVIGEVPEEEVYGEKHLRKSVESAAQYAPVDETVVTSPDDPMDAEEEAFASGYAEGHADGIADADDDADLNEPEGDAAEPDSNLEIDGDAEVDLDDLDDADPVDITFGAKDGRAFSRDFLINEVKDIGQRGFARKHNVPRTTLQEWLKRI